MVVACNGNGNLGPKNNVTQVSGCRLTHLVGQPASGERKGNETKLRPAGQPAGRPAKGEEGKSREPVEVEVESMWRNGQCDN